MGKRSAFKRNPRDLYKTCDVRAAKALLPHIKDVTVYVEPCAGDSDLVRLLLPHGKQPVVQYDIHPLNRDVEKRDAFSLRPCDMRGARTIITNPPWKRTLLHPMIRHFMTLGVEVWMLFDADWAQTIQSAELMLYCRKTVSVGRLRWIPGTKTDGKDNAQWYHFSPHNVGEPTLFYGRTINGAEVHDQDEDGRREIQKTLRQSQRRLSQQRRNPSRLGLRQSPARAA